MLRAIVSAPCKILRHLRSDNIVAYITLTLMLVNRGHVRLRLVAGNLPEDLV